MSIIPLLVTIASIVGTITIATVIGIGNYSKARFYFAVGVYIACLWVLVQYVVQIFELKGDIGLELIRFSSALSFAMAAFIYSFIRSYIGRPFKSWAYWTLFIVFVICFILNMSGYMIQSGWGESSGVVVSESTILYQIYIITIGCMFAMAFFELSQYIIKLKTKNEKIQNGLILVALLQVVISVVVASIFFPSSAESQVVFPISLLIMSIIVGLAIVKYQLFDIKFAVIRTVAYALSLLTLSLAYYGLAYMLSVFIFHSHTTASIGISPVNILLALVLAFIFQPVKSFFDKVTNHIFYKDNYSNDDFFAKINMIATQNNDLGDLLRNSATEIAKTIKIDQVFFVVLKGEGVCQTVGTNHHGSLPFNDVISLNEFVELGDNKVINRFLLSEGVSGELIRKLMICHKIEIIIPLILSGNVIGYLCLGGKKSGRYTSRDINVLKTASDELTIAIQNALAVQEIREFNETLKQRVANATRELRASNTQLQRLDKAKDEFVSMASHQLRTPLTTVKGYISMVMDGDAGDITNEQRNLLNEAFLSSERMVGLINDFLNVSRIQTGKFVIDKHPTDLSQLVNQEIDRLRASASSRNMEFVFEKPDDFPMINIDEGKIREVVMNFSDNAIYYSHEGSKIKVTLAIEGDNVIFKVKDTGIGVPIEEQAHLFSKFYRASNAKRQRPDGTGVGLFLAKKVITAHNGKVLFETVQDEGSTFGFSLPIEQSE